jgi:hypothetical protein
MFLNGEQFKKQKQKFSSGGQLSALIMLREILLEKCNNNFVFHFGNKSN